MRKNRNSDVVTSSHHDSDEEQDQEQSVDDSEDDWKPEKKKGAAGGKGKRKSTASAAGTPKGRKKAKKDESEEESEEEEDDEDEDFESEESDEEGGKEKKSGGAKKARMSVGKNQPDKDGNMELYLFKNDLTKEFRADEKLCMWRRDGASLLQKYMVVPEESQSQQIVFKASSVYSCWEEKRKNDFFQIKVQLIGDKKEGKVKVVDVAEFEKFAVEDRPKVDITPKGAEGGENYEEGSEEDFEENEEDEE